MTALTSLSLCLLFLSAFGLSRRSQSKVQSSTRWQAHSGPGYGPNNFGDIMSDRQTAMWIPDAYLYSPMERVILTANGNLQRILSAYYGLPVSVEVIMCEKTKPMTYAREVLITLQSQKANSDAPAVCHVQGEIMVHDEAVLAAIESKAVGVGQLFKYLQVLPSFALLAAGRASVSSARPTLHELRTVGRRQRDQMVRGEEVTVAQRAEGAHVSLWRDYELSSKQLTCRFIETFTPHFLTLDQDLDLHLHHQKLAAELRRETLLPQDQRNKAP